MKKEIKKNIFEKLQKQQVDLSMEEFDILNDALELYIKGKAFNDEDVDQDVAIDAEALIHIKYDNLSEKGVSVSKGYTIRKLRKGYTINEVYDVLSSFQALYPQKYIDDFYIIK